MENPVGFRCRNGENGRLSGAAARTGSLRKNKKKMRVL